MDETKQLLDEIEAMNQRIERQLKDIDEAISMLDILAA